MLTISDIKVNLYLGFNLVSTFMAGTNNLQYIIFWLSIYNFTYIQNHLDNKIYNYPFYYIQIVYLPVIFEWKLRRIVGVTFQESNGLVKCQCKQSFWSSAFRLSTWVVDEHQCKWYMYAFEYIFLITKHWARSGSLSG